VKRPLWIALLAAVVFVAIVIARLPASWVIPTGRGQAFCTSVDGSIWSGTCAGFSIRGTPVGDVNWQLLPLRLAAGKLAAHVTVTQSAANAIADVELGLHGRVTARNVVADMPLDPKLIPGLPPTLHGHAHAELALVQIQNGVITELKGRVEARDLEELTGRPTPLGSYVVNFPGGTGDPIGRIRDLDGPLSLEGTLHLTRQPGFELEGLVAPRPGAPPELANNMRFLGSPDASGRWQFSLAGTF